MIIKKLGTSMIIVLGLLLVLLIPITTLSNDNTYYGPVTLPTVNLTYTISMNLTDSRPSISFLQSIEATYPLLYSEDTLVTNTTTPWVATANKEFTLYITNATPTTINTPILLNATSYSNSTGGITWVLHVPSQWVYPQLPVYAQWYVAITEDINGLNFVVFLFKTGNESLSQLLNELSTVGGYLPAISGEPYYLWNYYYGYNQSTKAISIYYAVGLPGISIFYTWVGHGINASSWPQQGFDEAIKSFEFGFGEYVNNTLIEQVELPVNETVGQLTDYGYEIYGRPRLLPFGPVIYISPILLLSNGTIANPACLSNTYFPLIVDEILSGNVLFPVYSYKGISTDLYELDNSLIFGGYALSYDFFNETAIPLTTEEYLTPSYMSYVNQFTSCTVQLYVDNNIEYLDNMVNNTNNGYINSSYLINNTYMSRNNIMNSEFVQALSSNITNTIRIIPLNNSFYYVLSRILWALTPNLLSIAFKVFISTVHKSTLDFILRAAAAS